MNVNLNTRNVNALMHFVPGAWNRELVTGLQHGTVLRGHAGTEILADLPSPSCVPLSGAISAREEGRPFSQVPARRGRLSRIHTRAACKQAMERP